MSMVTANMTLDNVQDLLTQAGLGPDSDLIAMHLTEIEEEADNYLDQFTTFRVLARLGEASAAQEVLVEISVSLQHLAHHAQAVTPMLDRALGVEDE